MDQSPRGANAQMNPDFIGSKFSLVLGSIAILHFKWYRQLGPVSTDSGGRDRQFVTAWRRYHPATVRERICGDDEDILL
jgi:hypothetical protein